MRGGGLLRASRELGVRYGRMTVQDVAQLGAVFTQVASRQARDTAVAVQRRARRAIDARRG